MDSNGFHLVVFCSTLQANDLVKNLQNSPRGLFRLNNIKSRLVLSIDSTAIDACKGIQWIRSDEREIEKESHIVQTLR